VEKIEEVFVIAQHAYVCSHWVHRVTLESGQQYAMTFTDRQLGNMRLVTPWEEYEKKWIENVFGSSDLGSHTWSRKNELRKLKFEERKSI
jgi:hypothetical protein